MTDLTSKTRTDTQDHSDTKKSYVHPDVIDLLSVDETEGKFAWPIEIITTNGPS